LHAGHQSLTVEVSFQYPQTRVILRRQSGPVLVLTHDPERLASDPAVEAVSDLGIVLARAEELAGDRAVSIFGAHVARQVLALGRLDEIIVQIVPIVLGDGVRLFGQPPTSRVRLERTYVGTSGMLTDIRFRVAAADRRVSHAGGAPVSSRPAGLRSRRPRLLAWQA
jgi:riboflavin biosynthesis pyrimidine reductase